MSFRQKRKKEKGSLEKAKTTTTFAFAGFVPRCFRLFYYYIQGELVFNLLFVFRKGNKTMATKIQANTGMYRNFVSPQIKDEKKLVGEKSCHLMTRRLL